MTVLLDTHAFLWWVADDPRLSPRARRAIADQRTRVLFSVVSAWEIEMKAAAGRLALTVPFPRFLDEQLRTNPFELLDLRLSHVMRAHELPALHADPFDRLLAAQTLTEGASLITGDEMIARYPIQTRW